MTEQLGLDGTSIIPAELERRTHRGGKPPLSNPLLPCGRFEVDDRPPGMTAG